MYQRILCPVDGSPTSERGLDEAVALARDQRAALRLMHVVDLHWLALDGAAGMASAELIDSMRAGGETILRDAAAKASAAGLECETMLLESAAAPVSDLVVEQAAAWPADLVVIGTHGRRGAQRLVMGSDAERVVRACGVPVLLVQAPETGGRTV